MSATFHKNQTLIFERLSRHTSIVAYGYRNPRGQQSYQLADPAIQARLGPGTHTLDLLMPRLLEAASSIADFLPDVELHDVPEIEPLRLEVFGLHGRAFTRAGHVVAVFVGRNDEIIKSLKRTCVGLLRKLNIEKPRFQLSTLQARQ